MTPEKGQKIAYLFCFVVIAMAVTGYFVGLQSPMNPLSQTENAKLKTDDHPLTTENRKLKTDVVPATHYSKIHIANLERTAHSRTSLLELRQNFDSLAEFSVTPEEKKIALSIRDQNRAFNGAPPTIPHSIDQMSSTSCIACHAEGFKSQSLQISKMSHQFLANCTQCHVENNPTHMNAIQFRENSFAGLPAPNGGPRAFEGAPPMIPHSTWMRVNCMSCHGFTSQQGIRTTHPWRQNCQQCHAPSSKLDQVRVDAEPKFLSPPNVNQ